jgi:Mg/Co/Ni transporter MgtE
VASLKAMKKEDAAKELVALAAKSIDDCAIVLPSVKPGYARAALTAMDPAVVGELLADMDADEIATCLSAMVRHTKTTSHSTTDCSPPLCRSSRTMLLRTPMRLRA